MTSYKFILVFYLAFSCSTNSSFGQSDSSLKAEINQALIEEGLTGAVWSTVDSNGKISFDAVGINNKETGKQLKPTDKVHVGSITKTLIASGILRLATVKKLKLNDPIKKYLSLLPFQNKWQETNPITIRHLLDHTSGLTDVRLWQVFSKNAGPDSPLEFAFTKDQDVLNLHSQPGSIFSYSNMGYTLLAMIIESVTKERYENYLDKNLLLPLGMLNSTFEFVSQEGAKADTALAYGHLDDQIIYAALPMYLRPAGQFTTTANDMAVFAQFLLSDGTLNGKEFISPNYLSQMGQPQNTISKQNGLKTGYGIGAMTRDRHGSIGIAHSGNIVGYHAMLYWIPESKTAFFISHNMDSETANYERFNEILINHLKLRAQENNTIPIKSKNLKDWEGYYIPVFSKVEPFAYFDILSGFTRITTNDEFVTWGTFQKPIKTLLRVSENLLIADGKIDPSHVFYKNDTGKTYISDGFSSHKKVSGYYLLVHWISFILGCVGLVYLFLSGVIQTIIFKKKIISKPVFQSFSAILFLLIPIPFLFLQSFAAMGDKTAASILLFISTCILPLGLFFSFGLYLKRRFPNWKNKLDFVFVVFSIQWIIVLFTWELIPFKLWI